MKKTKQEKDNMKSPNQSDFKKLRHHSQIYFAVFCAEQVFHLIEEKHKPICRHAIDIAKLFIEGKAAKEECRAAATDAYVAYAAYAASSAVNATYAAYAAAYADAYAAGAAGAAVYATNAAKNKQAVIKAQWEYYNELLAFETIVEDILLA